MCWFMGFCSNGTLKRFQWREKDKILGLIAVESKLLFIT